MSWGALEMRLDAPTQRGESHHLLVGQRRLVLSRRLDRVLLCPAHRRGSDGELLGGDRLVDDAAVPHPVGVRVDQARDERLAKSEAGLDGGDRAVRRDGVGGEHHTRSVRRDHLLHDHGHVNGAVVDAVAQAVGHGPLGEQRCPAPADVVEDRRRPRDVQVGVVLAGERRGRQVLGRRTRPHGVRDVRAQPDDRRGDRRRDIVGYGDRFDRPADVGAERADRIPVVGVQARQPIELTTHRRSDRDDVPEGVGGHAESGRQADAVDPRQLAQMRALATDEIGAASGRCPRTPARRARSSTSRGRHCLSGHRSSVAD